MEKLPENSIRTAHYGIYRDLFLRLKDAAILVNLETTEILDRNDPAERFFETVKFPESPEGTERPEFSEQRNFLLNWVIEKDRDGFQKHIRMARRRYHAHDWEWLAAGKDGSLHFLNVNACKISLSNGEDVIQIILQDRTAERVAELKLEQYVDELETLNKKLDALARTDGLTGLTNVRTFKEYLAVEHARCNRYGGSYSLVLIDADHFKNYNDTNGHQAGDDLLKRLSALIQRNCRKTDYPARYGGEEFIILCSAVGSDQAIHLAERIRKEVEISIFPHRERQPKGIVSVSIGVASFPINGMTPEDIIEKADEALYRAKDAGRNQVQVAPRAPLEKIV